MAQPAPAQRKPDPVPTPETRAYALVNVGPTLWVRREYVIRGQTVVSHSDSTPDTKARAIGAVIRPMERT